LAEVAAALAEVAEEEGEGALLLLVFLLPFVKGRGGLEEEGDTRFLFV